MDQGTESIVDELVELTHRVRRGGRGADTRSRGVGGANGFVLRHLYENDEASPSELRDKLDVSTPRVTAILNDLEQRGLVSRAASESDRRRVEVTLTREGRKIAAEQTDGLRSELSALVERIGPEDAQALIRILRLLAKEHGTFPF